MTGGDLAASFGSRALTVFFGEFGNDDPFAATSFVAPARIEISALDDVAPIPHPAGGLLLVLGLALIGLRRRAAR